MKLTNIKFDLQWINDDRLGIAIKDLMEDDKYNLHPSHCLWSRALSNVSLVKVN